MDYHDKKQAKRNLAKALEALGWKLYGWHEDKSDAMTDYWHPASWDGIAEKEGAIVCVDISGYDVERQSARVQTRLVPQPGVECSRCGGSGVDPKLTWTIEEARKEPGEWNLERVIAMHRGGEYEILPERDGIKYRGTNGMTIVTRCGLAGTVSPLHFGDHGKANCLDCHGSGKTAGKPIEEVVCTWPVFKANPPHKTWHVEVDGQIVASGVGLKKAYGHTYGDMEGAHELAARIDCARHGRSSGDDGDDSVSAAEGNGVRLVHNVAKNGLELYFTAKPSETVRASLKSRGWRWARRNACWYVRKTATQEAFANSVVEQFSGTAAVWGG